MNLRLTAATRAVHTQARVGPPRRTGCRPSWRSCVVGAARSDEADVTLTRFGVTVEAGIAHQRHRSSRQFAGLLPKEVTG